MSFWTPAQVKQVLVQTKEEKEKEAGAKGGGKVEPPKAKPLVTGDDFSDTERAGLQAAVKFAKEHAKKAHVFIKEANDYEAADKVAQVRKWFGKGWDGPFMNNIQEVYRAIEAQADVKFLVKYKEGGDAQMQTGVSEDTVYAWTDFGKKEIVLCPKFFSAEEDIQGYCILHEMSHFVNQNVVDETNYGAANAEEFARGDGARDTYTNAYSYQYFAESLK